jgi:hypothetical protein
LEEAGFHVGGTPIPGLLQKEAASC